ncbi:hypothetical protein Poli38472_006668 [Pythium oligandrum]|uniref:Jacalin-type lectin domain-containing protein n=1 Tax=Pythium oligandrum TaxID=41045 RepID=A0A8K1C588_PYTOL|nr:hypothetical protein Poli38472_006668 [Pythium oligandrum]|eukprot:TMW56658.1 hypothetical protein Poli38472_006668 [Pythium oligandrum]
MPITTPVIIPTTLADVQAYNGRSSIVVLPHAALKLKKPFTSFGYTWQERVLAIGAIAIGISGNQVVSFQNLVVGSYELSSVQATGETHLFQLIRGETIRQVDVMTSFDSGIRGIRFHTTLRSSAWFGSGKNGLRHVFLPPQGYAIHCLYGDYGRFCRKLGMFHRELPLQADEGEATAQHEVTASALVIKCKQDDTNDVGFTQKAVSGLRAIVVQSTDVIERIWALSAEQATEAEASLGDNEHWVDLMEYESIVKMEVMANATAIVAVRWTMDYKTTPWIGNKAAATTKVVKYYTPDDHRVCGFHGTMGPQGLTSLGVLTTCESLDTPPPKATKTEGKRPVDNWDVLNIADWSIAD